MKKQSFLSLYILLLLCSTAISVVAQKDKKTNDDLSSDDVTIEKRFEAKLLETEKQKINLTLPAIDTSVKAQNYNIVDKKVKVDYAPPSIRPIAMKGDELVKYNKGYLKAGYGIPKSPYVEASYIITDKQYSIGVEGRYHAADFSKDPYYFQKFGKTNFKVGGNYYLDNGLGVKGDIGYQRHNLRWYGKADSTTSENDITQHFNMPSLSLGIFNSKGTDFSWNADIDFYRLGDNTGARENGFIVKAGATKWINGQHEVGLNIKTDLSSYRETPDVIQKLNNVYLQPKFVCHGESFSAKLGANVISHLDNFKVFPDVEAQAMLGGNQFVVFAGWKGDYQKNTFRSLSNYNPFISNSFKPKNTSYQDIYGGIKGHISMFDYSAQGGYKQTQGLALFLNNAKGNRFDVLYDSVKIVYIKGNVSIKPAKDMEILASLTQNIFTPKTEAKAWHLPATELNTTLKVGFLENKLRLKGELFFIAGAHAKGDSLKATLLTPIFDISAGAEYDITKNIGIFAQANNILNQHAQRWLNYQSYGVNLLGGIIARF